MQKKLLFSLLLLTLAIVFGVSFTFANNDTSSWENAADGVRNVVGDVENGVENAARDISNTSKDATRDMENGSNDSMSTNNNSSTDNSNKDGMTGGMTNSSQNYTAQRTATTTDSNGLLGMNSTTWIWLIMAILAIAIIALVYYYSTQATNRHYNSDDQ